MLIYWASVGSVHASGSGSASPCTIQYVIVEASRYTHVQRGIVAQTPVSVQYSSRRAASRNRNPHSFPFNNEAHKVQLSSQVVSCLPSIWHHYRNLIVSLDCPIATICLATLVHGTGPGLSVLFLLSTKSLRHSVPAVIIRVIIAYSTGVD